MKKTYYEILGVTSDATVEEIRSSAKKLVEKYHPSKYPGNLQAEARFKQIKSMYAVLADAKKRSAYDASVGLHEASSHASLPAKIPELNKPPEVKKPEVRRKKISPVHPLLQDEKIIYLAKIHWSIYLNPLLVLFISIYLAFINPSFLEMYVSEFDFLHSKLAYFRMGLWVMTGIGIIMLLQAFYRHLITQVMITSKRTLAKFSLFTQEISEISHAQFENIEVKQSFLGNLLGFGSIKIRGTKGRGVGGLRISIHCLSSPTEFEKKLLRSIKSYFEK